MKWFESIYARVFVGNKHKLKAEQLRALWLDRDSF
jgi:hypothetical protein